MKVSIITLGCRTNQAESLSFEKEALLNGHEIVDLQSNPDFCIINTCSVTSKADAQSRQLINNALKTNAKVIITGCHVQLNLEYYKNQKSLTVISNDNKHLINNLFLNTLGIVHKHIERARPIIKVQEGCQNNCSYCTIPLSRGAGNSVPAKKIIEEIIFYENLGFNEVVLSGTNLGQYRFNEEKSNHLLFLLELILKSSKIPRLRISSIELEHVNDDFINFIKEKRICKHLHIPLQSGSDEVLKVMKRPYLTKEYKDRVLKIKALYPDMSIGTDLIVGFPSEGSKEYEETLDFVQKLPFSYLHIFPFSKRKNTKAFFMKANSNQKEIRQRVTELRSLADIKKEEFIRSQLGKVVDLIIEKQTTECAIGTTNNYIQTYVTPSEGLKRKELIYIKLNDYRNKKAYGKAIL